MPLLLQELLGDSGLGLELVAGRAGLRERGPVRWAHISEIPDPTPWLEGGEILLTTGLGVRHSAQLQRRLIAGLDERGCPGVGFGVGVTLDAVPAAMLREADRRRLPLFTVPYEVPFIAVTKRVSRQVFDEHYATLRSAVDLHRSVLRCVLSGNGVAGVLEAVAARMPGFALVLYDYYGEVLARAGALHGSAGVDAARLWALLDPRQRGGQANRDSGQDDAGGLGDGVMLDGLVVVPAVARLSSEVEAVLALVGERAPHEHERLLLEQGLTGVSLELARGHSVREAHRARVDDLLEEIAEGRIAQQAVVRQLGRLGLIADGGFRVLCLRQPGPATANQPALCAVAEDAIAAAGSPPVVGRYDGAVFALVQPAEGDQAQRVATAVAARGWNGVRIGRSRPTREAAGLGTAVREAVAAAALPGDGGVVDVDTLGLTGLLAGFNDEHAAEAFAQGVLGAVLEADRRQGTQLLETLREYLLHGCRPGPAANALCVHRHTLAYRLERVRDLTGRDLRNGRDLLELGLALELVSASA